MADHLSLVQTADGSSTIFNELVGENYHSKHGAVQESQHVFLKSGLQYFQQLSGAEAISVLEVGFGTGLNFLISADYCRTAGLNLEYTGIEAYPLPEEMIFGTGYDQYVSAGTWTEFKECYSAALGSVRELNAFCKLEVSPVKLMEFDSSKTFDVMYFDAFAEIHQPEMWSLEALTHITKFIKPGGVFVTYAITGNLKRAMKSLGFSIEKAPGAPGKREMLRATKNL
ncbi:tRNA U34 5-methylaminomethyl-2-thiouridine-forming methyltransferase MnmC [Arcticibacter pallidicorallinus]|uniref:tRNA U34 5-methylaminomethyl-2-thiouridine-forming methyltransferase MnmC n=1 Tax=Arcticibacter pallidicorallinus TaxID=1259464 RepID=A0A2T0U443_9SPHI|nr:tRNA (5-methylaminomethyl-2-thiouridine)(34)-methyltransferase MnmD [Arcticibacter pallidicorallinus]PRY52681.1 tRNA U34 5-methylaminomethyl-2-thiouridine-forming methyltransferase MnmC [Arcticibacter pallidicorallinus]